ncbi:MAG: type II secretion system F family protein [Betaproteobacteria bacterium]|nr:type II secretion system F family protein [Betaproteobacteria bacterium]
MPAFDYRGRNARGDLVTGTLDAPDSSAVASQLLNTGITPVEIRESAGRGASGTPDWYRSLTAPPITDMDVMLFSRQMYTLLKAGIPILRALAGLQESTANPTFRAVVADLRASLEAGRELSAALRRHPTVFDNFYVSLIRVGETTGMLDDTFHRLFGHIEFEREMRDRIKTAVRYPMIVLVVIAVAVAIINFAVIPAFARIFEANQVPLPLLTRVLIWTSNFFLAYWHLVSGALIAGVFLFRWWKRTPVGRIAWDRMKTRIPVAGKIVNKATLARMARSLSLAIHAGVPIVQSLTVVSRVVDNAHMEIRIDQMREGVERGESVTRSATAAGIFTPMVLQMIAVGEESGDLDDMLSEVADIYEGEVDYEIRTLTTQIEPILTVAMGILVAILALGVFLPIWDLGKVMLKK